MHPECVFWMAANWPWIGRKTMTSRFVDMASWSTFFDVDVFPMSGLVTGPSFMSISWLVSELWQFLFKGLTRNLEIGKTRLWFLPNIPRRMCNPETDGKSFDTNVFIKGIMNPHNCLLKNTTFSVKTSNE